MNKKNYTEPTLCTYNNDLSKSWFVYFDITDPSTGITERKQFRGKINYSHNIKERTVLGNYLVKYWNERLKSGWNPFINSVENELSKMNFSESLDFALSKCVLASKSKSCYTSAVKFFKEAANNLHYDRIQIIQLKRMHIKLMLDELKESKSWSNHAYNKYLGYIAGVLSRLVDYEIIEHNPAHKIKSLPLAETQKFIPLDEVEKKKLRNELTEIHPNFFTYLMVVYHTGIRPKEVLALKICDINFQRKIITIKPDLQLENSKTKTIRIVPINEHLLELLTNHCIDCQDANYYLFGSPFKSGIGNKGSGKGAKYGSMREDYFKPSINHIKRDTPTKLWNSLVMKKIGINKHQYALKHTGADDKILAGIDIDALQSMYGHTSKYMTARYITKLKDVHNEKIRILSPNF